MRKARKPNRKMPRTQKSAALSLFFSSRKLGVVLLHALKGLGAFLWSICVRYPRHALAAAASVVILGAIEYTQWKGSNSPPVTQISGSQAESKQAKTERPGSPVSKTAGADPNPADPKIAQAENKSTPNQRPDAAAAVAPSQAASGSRETPPSSKNDAPADPALRLAAPSGQPGLPEPGKSDQGAAESAVVSAPGLLVAAAETPAPPPASSLGKDGPTPSTSGIESAPPAPSSAGGKDHAATDLGKSAARGPVVI